MSRYIHIEGVDLSGKSSTTKAVIEQQQSEWAVQDRIITPHKNPLRDLADRLSDEDVYSSDAVGIAYAAALRADLDLFEYPTIDTIQESTLLLRSLAYHAINNNRSTLRLFEDMAPLHPKFDRSYLLTASREERLNRLARRAINSTNDLLIVRDPKRFKKMEDSIIDYAKDLFNTQIIDTASMSAEEVAAYINQDIPAEHEKSGAKDE